jgi:Ca2+/Na+ antiporter
MNTYTVVKFLHVFGAIGYFVAIGVWLFGLAALQRAQRVEPGRVLTDLLGRLGSLFGISILIILAAGLYMTFTSWDFQTGWIDVALISLVLIAPTAGFTVESRRRVIARLARAAPDGPLPEALERHTHAPTLLTMVWTVTALLLGIVFLMPISHR